MSELSRETDNGEDVAALKARVRELEAERDRLEPFTTIRGETFTHCTMPERAVLAATFAVPERDLRQLLADWRGTAVGDFAASELARRGLK